MRYASAPPALALLAGCALGSFHRVGPGLAAAAVAAAWTLGLCAWYGRSARAFVAAALAGFAACGAALSSVATERAVHPPLRAAIAAVLGGGAIGDAPSEPLVVQGRLAADAAPSETGVRLILDVSAFTVDGRAHAARGRVSLSVAGDAPADKVDDWRRGRTLRFPAQLRRPARYLNAGVPDQELSLARRGTALVGTVKSAMLVQVAGRGHPPAELAAEARLRARRCLDAAVGRHDPMSAAIVRAILLGDRAGLDEDAELRLQEAGTYHVLAISGGNIAILAGLLLGLARLIGAGRSASSLSAAAALSAYAYLVGGGASVERATLMAVVYLVGRAIDHRTRPLNAAAASAGFGAAVDPLLLFDVGAWFTYGATLAILVGAPPLLRRFAPPWRWALAPAGLFAASLSAEAALFPVGAIVFSRVTTAGLILNFAAIPLMTVVQVAGMGTLAAAAAAPWAVAPFAAGAHLAARGLVESARLVDLVPQSVVRLAPPSIAVAAAYYAGVAAAFWLAGAESRRPVSSVPLRRARHAALTVAVLAGLWILLAPQTRLARTRQLEVTFFDVGQGASTLVRFPSGHALLVDAGGAAGSRFDIGRRVVAPAIRAAGAERLTYVVATHGDADHVGGAAAIVRDFRPAEVWEGVAVPPEPLMRHLRAASSGARGAWRTVRRGDVLSFGDVDVLIRHPAAPDWERQRVRNDDSVVMEIRSGDVSVVLTGDIESAAEAELAGLLEPAGVRVLQAPHHGSATSSTWAFIRAASPGAVIISAGRGNRYGHPHAAVLGRYAESGAQVFRTDVDGAITLRTDGRAAEIRTFTGRTAVLRPTPARVPPA